MSTSTTQPPPSRDSTNPSQDPSNQLEGMDKQQKLAAFLVVLGPELASSILSEFEEAEVEELTTQMAKVEFVPYTMQKALLQEFSGVAMEAATSTTGGPLMAKDVIERSLGSLKANEFISRIAPTRNRTIDTALLREIPTKQLANILRQEQPQTWALILSYLEPNRCAELLAQLPANQRIDIVERIAIMEPVSSEVVQMILNDLKGHLQQQGKMDFTTSGGTKILADILNTLDENISNQVLGSLEQRNPDLSRSIRKLLFTFEDISSFEKPAIMRLLREVDTHVLAVALKTSSESLKAIVMASLTKRAGEALSEEIQFMPPVRLSEVEQAQEQIIEKIRALEANGEINISKRGDKRDAIV